MISRFDPMIYPGGVGIDLEQKVRYTGHMDDNGKVVSFDHLHNADLDLRMLISITILV